MKELVAVVALLLIAIVLWDGFETIVLPRRIARPFRLARVFYRGTWPAWSALGRRLSGNSRETYLSLFGPLSLIFLLILWASMLILAFGMLQWAAGSHLQPPPQAAGFGTDVYMSATSFFTLGLGDVTPHSALARAITAVEAGGGFGFLALVISYLPVLYQAFSRREVAISRLDARAGSPPSAGELMTRFGSDGGPRLAAFFGEWEQWSGQLLESHLSYPVLGFFRSQHERQSWLAALTAILDACALVLSGVVAAGEEANAEARLAFALARHAAVDLSQIFSGEKPATEEADRLPPEQLSLLLERLGSRQAISSGEQPLARLAELRSMYEGYVAALARYLLMPLPSWLPSEGADDWESTAE